jgi:exopolysaccharide production protein ExoZ
MQRHGRLANLQLLRIMAALAVVLHHVRWHAPVFDKSFNPLSITWGHSGVDVFFVISGFLMVYIIRNGRLGPGEFILRRFARVWPLYAVMTLTVAAIVTFAPLYYKGDADPAYVIKSMFFIPTARAMDGHYYPVIGPGWTLNLEIAFYTLFGLSLFFRRWVFALAVLGTGFMLASHYSSIPAFHFYSAASGGIFLEFFLGVGLGLLYLRKIRVPAIVAATMAIVGTVLIIFPPPVPRHIGIGLPALMVVFGALYMPSPNNPRIARLFNFLGCTSYALYLSHFAVLSAVRRVGINAHMAGTIPASIYIPGAVTACMAVAALIYWLIEKRLEKHVGVPMRRLGDEISSALPETPAKSAAR